jgi:acyl carrier protein
MPEDLMSRVIAVIAATQKIPVESIEPDSTFEQLKIDSLDGINIMFALENEFNINIPDDAARGMRTINDVAAAIEKLLEEGEAPVAVRR